MKKIVIIGPESTGKSTLSAQLAEHYGTVYCPEFAREYLMELNRPYDYSDLLNIAHGQIELEDKLERQASNDRYFIDTDMHVMKVWCEVAFEKCHAYILKEIARREYDFFLLCTPDLPWVQDELREYPDPSFRRKLFLMYRDLMINNNRTPWAEISGQESQRLQMAITILDTVFNA